MLDIGSLGVSSVFGKLCWTISLMLMMRALGPEHYGALMVLWSLVGILAPLTDAGFSQLLLREGARRPAWIAPILRCAVLSRLILGAVIVYILVLVTRCSVSPIATLGVGVLVLAVVAPLLDSFFLTATAVAQTEQRISQLSAWRVTGFASLPIMLFLALPSLPQVQASAGAYAFASFLTLSGFFLTRACNARQELDNAPAQPPPFSKLTMEALPFLFMGIAATAYGKIEVAVLGTVRGVEDAGFYHAAYQGILLVFSLSEIVFTAIFATLYRTGARPELLESRWRPICRMLCTISVLALPPLWWHAAEVMAFLGGAEFAEAAPLLRALLPMLALLPAAAALNFLLLLDQPRARATIDTACVLITALLVLLVARMPDAWWSALAASVAYAGACIAAATVTRECGLRLPWVLDFARASLIILPSLLLWLVPWPAWWIGAIAQVSIGAILLIIFRFIGPRDLHDLAH